MRQKHTGLVIYSLQERTTPMKTAGVVILVIGLLMTVYTGFTYVTKEKVVDLGALEITKENEHAVNWQPYFGIGAMAIGGAVLLFGKKRSLTA